MSVRFLFIGLLLMLSHAAFSQSIEKSVNYNSRVAVGGSTSAVPVGHGFNNFGPFTAYDRVWVFYSDGENAVWRTKPIEADESEWSDPHNVFPSPNGLYFDVAFDGQYFHFIRSLNGDLKYRRGEAQSNGMIQFNNEVTAFSNPTWKLRSIGSAAPRHYTIAVDNTGRVWVVFKVADGNQETSTFRPMVSSSVATDGRWQTRTDFPVFLDVGYEWRGNGRAPSVAELSPGKMLFVWSSDRRSSGHPDQGMRARVWVNGTFGPVEDTRLLAESATTSMVVPQPDIALVNVRNMVARRNQNGTWSRVDPTGMNDSHFNVLTTHNGGVRLWDVSGDFIRYRETVDNGSSWGPVTGKWGSTGVDIYQVNGTHANGSHGSHHSLIWSTGNLPYDIRMGIEGTAPSPGAPALVSPPNGTKNIKENTTLVWRSIDIAHSYDVQVARNQELSSPIVNENVISDTLLDIAGLEPDSTFYWRVRAVSEGGLRSDWSEVWNFSTLGVPSIPELAKPADGAQNQPTSIEFAWFSVIEADDYQLQIATVQDFSTTFADVDNIQDTTYNESGLDIERTYYWRVRARNEYGTGNWSSTWSFTTVKAAPDPPALVYPENDATNVLTTVELSWQESPDAQTYRVQVSKQPDFAATVVNERDITNTSFEVRNLEYSTTYYWRVNATNEGGTGDWSSVWSFTTIIEKPEAPVLVSPDNAEDLVATFPVLRWDESARAEAFRVQVSVDSQFTNLVLDESDIDSTQYTFTEELNGFTTYYWRVNAANVGGISDWSTVFHFSTGEAVPHAPALVGPNDEASNVTDATLLWNSVQRATSYRVQIAQDDDFSTLTVDQDDITNTFYKATNLEKWTVYYWRVRGVGAGGQGYWSETRSFETGDIVSVELIDNQIPAQFALGQNYPNPFNPTTTIQFALPTEANVRLEVYNLLGQHVSTIIDGEYYAAGIYEASWDARSAPGIDISSGIYIYRIIAGDFVETKKMILMK